MIAEEVALAVDHAHVKSEEDDAPRTPDDREIDSLESAIRPVVDHSRVLGEPFGVLAIDQIETIRLGGLALVVGASVVRRPLLAGEVRTAIVMVPPSPVAPVECIGPRHETPGVLHHDRAVSTAPLGNFGRKRWPGRYDDDCLAFPATGSDLHLRRDNPRPHALSDCALSKVHIDVPRHTVDANVKHRRPTVAPWRRVPPRGKDFKQHHITLWCGAT